MKKYAAIAIITAAATSSVQAAGFQPWAEGAVESKQDAVQTVVPVGPFYRDGAPQVDSNPTTTNQADVVIKPWYAAGRV